MDAIVKKPPMEKSNEAKLEQLEMAREQGKTYVNALKEMIEKRSGYGRRKKSRKLCSCLCR